MESAVGKTRERADSHAVGTALVVLGITGLVILAAKQFSKQRSNQRVQSDWDEEPIGERTLFRILTIKAHPANVESDWNDFVESQGSEESRSATVTFAAAPGARGTEVRAELTYTPASGGKIGETVQRMRHKSPGQLLGRDLKLFKMLIETGEPVRSDASIHKHMHPAQPDKQIPRFARDDNMEEAR